MIDRELRHIISEELEFKITQITDRKLEEWYRQKIEHQVDEAIKNAFKKIMMVKFE